MALVGITDCLDTIWIAARTLSSLPQRNQAHHRDATGIGGSTIGALARSFIARADEPFGAAARTFSRRMGFRT